MPQMTIVVNAATQTTLSMLRARDRVSAAFWAEGRSPLSTLVLNRIHAGRAMTAPMANMAMTSAKPANVQRGMAEGPLKRTRMIPVASVPAPVRRPSR